MSVRTLARRLAEQGLTPARLVEELRQQLANRYLAERAFPLGRITYLLGYSDLSAFTRAFRRWTGRTPSEWRAELSPPRRPRHHQHSRIRSARSLPASDARECPQSRCCPRAGCAAEVMAGNVK